jgi:hypothetical protein
MRTQPLSCSPSPLAAHFRDNGAKPLFHLLYGIESGIPLCCVLAYVRENTAWGRRRMADLYSPDFDFYARFRGYGWRPCALHRMFPQEDLTIPSEGVGESQDRYVSFPGEYY